MAKGLGCRVSGFGLFRVIATIKQIEYGVYRDLILTYPKLYSTYLGGTIGWRV